MVSDNRRVINCIVVRALDFDEAIKLAQECPVLEQDAVIEVREILPRPAVVPTEKK